MTTPQNSLLQAWMLDRTINDLESYAEGGERVIDAPSLKDGRSMWAMFYGEGPRVSTNKGVERELVAGHLHLEDREVYESYYPTFGGAVIRVVYDNASGAGIIEGPTELSPAQQESLILDIEALL